MRPLALLLLLSFILSTAPASAADEKPAPGKQVSANYTNGEKKLAYWLYLPEKYESEKSSPLVIFLHGAGERGSDLEKVKIHGPPKLIAAGKHFPFIVCSPQCPEKTWWEVGVLDGMLDQLQKDLKIDPERIYLTGLSMGGYGTWNWAAKSPKRFAALAPICGGGDPKTVGEFKHIPIWVFHGAKDNVVPLKSSQEMVDALKALNVECKFTIYPEANHDSWTETYNNPELYDWFLKHKRGS